MLLRNTSKTGPVALASSLWQAAQFELKFFTLPGHHLK
jgi:hypothetical protein